MAIMTESEEREVREAIGRKWQGCANCRSRNAAIDQPVALVVLDRAIPSGVALSDRFIAVLPLVCDACGCVSLFSARELVRELREQTL